MYAVEQQRRKDEGGRMKDEARPPEGVHPSSFILHPSLDLYKRELLKWTARVNLIGPEARAHLDDHIAEAVTAAEILKPQGDVLDFGSGGGLPAIPMAIV